VHRLVQADMGHLGPADRPRTQQPTDPHASAAQVDAHPHDPPGPDHPHREEHAGEDPDARAGHAEPVDAGPGEQGEGGGLPGDDQPAAGGRSGAPVE